MELAASLVCVCAKERGREREEGGEGERERERSLSVPIIAVHNPSEYLHVPLLTEYLCFLNRSVQE